MSRIQVLTIYFNKVIQFYGYVMDTRNSDTK